ncbi:MAG: hypothetical protein L0L06_11255, partial [Enterococcus sp.]|nr:hypothetical protein [Enterococcus sp.]
MDGMHHYRRRNQGCGSVSASLIFFQFTDRLQQLERGFRDSRRKEGEVIHEKDCYGNLRGSSILLG